jgi:putative ABC transport system substrate-binding protein
MNEIFRLRFSPFFSDNLIATPQTASRPADQKPPHGPKSMGLAVIAFVLVVAGAVAEAQQPKKVFRIGYLSATDRVTDAPRAEGIRRALREFGYIEGQNIAFEYRHAEGKGGQPEFAAELVRLKVDLILVAGGDVGIRAAMNATKMIPIVLTGFGSDPVKAGFVESLARPGGNVTGFTILTTELGGKRLELLKEAVPKLTRVAVLHDPGAPGITREVKEDLPVAAKALKLTIQRWEVRNVEGLERVFAALNKQRPDGLRAPAAGAVMTANQKRIADFALKTRISSMYANSATVNDGGLMSYAADDTIRYQRVAYYVDRILKGAKPADLPVEQPMKFEFVINLKTANRIGLTIPPDLLARATRIIR